MSSSSIDISSNINTNTSTPTSPSMDISSSSLRKIKPRFPAARIKRIMQSDNDVGKINQATPFLVSKALELFINQLLIASIEQARLSASRKLTPIQMKLAISSQDKFDFLRHLTTHITIHDDNITTDDNNTNSIV